MKYWNHGASAAVLALLLAGTPSALADTLHVFCNTCTEINGTGGNQITQTTTNPPAFGFSVDPGPQTGDFFVDVLIPNNDTVSSLSISGTNGGAANTSPIAPTTPTSMGNWTSGFLVDFLGLNPAPQPKNPLDSWLGFTQAIQLTNSVDPTATGYKVYQADLGTNRLNANSSAPTTGPLLSLSALPLGAIVVGFLEEQTTDKHGNTVTNWISTAQSGALFEGAKAAPLPASLPLMATGLGAGYLVSMWRRRRNTFRSNRFAT